MASTSTEVLVTSESRINSSCLPTSVRKASTADHSFSVTRCFSITWCKAAIASGKTFCSLSLLIFVESTLVPPFPPAPTRHYGYAGLIRPIPFLVYLHNVYISRYAKRGHLWGPARRSIRLPLRTSSSLRPFAGGASRLQCLGGDTVTLGDGEEVGVDLVRERDAVLAMHGHPLVRAVPRHRDPLEAGCGRPLSRLLLLLIHAGEKFRHGKNGFAENRRKHLPAALGWGLFVHTGHLRP